ncbi:TIGR02300 family protein [Aliiruegeria sabulilitoris]|uniref:TIGR02300 family protein n=1 Tax=Aliiruegeria sabulilitoris TaxID=1510458 RepID=UPI00082EE80F|nr:TIGR02300 family protein [Aliiruegeria sabulilitoris]NDR58980.1 TIGR02300 family protein [Pseudoruegeria sp. M32A2M]
MPKEEWGVKRVCPTTGKRFYDLGRDPIVSPYTGEIVQLETGNKSRVLIKDEKDKQSAPEEEALIDDDDDLETDADVDLGDDVLDDDADDDNVSLDEIADVGSDEDDS